VFAGTTAIYDLDKLQLLWYFRNISILLAGAPLYVQPRIVEKSGNSGKTAAEQRGSRCYLASRSVGSREFPRLTRGGSLIIPGKTAKNSETA
jgi:hypothetical protein